MIGYVTLGTNDLPRAAAVDGQAEPRHPEAVRRQAGDGFYVGYFRDLDGNKLNAFCMV